MGYRFKNLPAGMEDLGPLEELSTNHKHILDPMGNKASSLVEPPVTWIKDIEVSQQEGRDFFYPKLETPLGIEYGASRDKKLFYKMEKELYMQLFVNHVSKYLFGVEYMNIEEFEDGYDFVPNLEFQKLPVYEVEHE